METFSKMKYFTKNTTQESFLHFETDPYKIETPQIYIIKHSLKKEIQIANEEQPKNTKQEVENKNIGKMVEMRSGDRTSDGKLMSELVGRRGPGGVPLFGNLAELGSLPHRHLMTLTDTYGSLIQLKLGSWKTEVVHGYQANKEVFLKNGKNSSSRPDFRSYKHYGHGKSLSFQPFNQLWQQQRKVVSRTINNFISSGLVTELANTQMKSLVDKWETKANHGESFDPLTDLAEAVSTFIYSFCYGRDQQLSDNTSFKDILMNYNPATDLFAMGNNIDLLPFFLRPFLATKEAQHTERINKLMNCHAEIKTKVEESFLKQPHSEATCLQEAMLIEIEKMFGEDESEKVIEGHEKLHRDHLQNLSAEFLSAGSETSTASLLWLLRYMAKNPSAQKNVQHEIDQYMAKKLASMVNEDEGEMVEFEDKAHLPYTEACRLEALRCVAVVPFGLPHYSSGDFKSCDKTIAKDTLLFPNLWSVGRDKSVWSEPHRFIPERHLIFNNTNSNSDNCKNVKTNTDKNQQTFSINQLSSCPAFKSTQLNSSSTKPSGCPFSATLSKEEKFYPFGVGKRRCVGEQMAKILNFVIFANIMLNFNVKLHKDATRKVLKSTLKGSKKLENNFHNDNFVLRNMYKLVESSWSVVKSYVGGDDQKDFKNDEGDDVVSEASDDEDEDVVEEFGDVMLPSSYKIILEKRRLF